MNNKVIILLACLLLGSTGINAQDTTYGEQQPAATAAVDKQIAKVQSLYEANLYQEAFDLLRTIDQEITASDMSEPAKATARYKTSKERMQMYVKMRRGANAAEHLAAMERLAGQAGDDAINSDLLYHKTIYHYTFGQTAQGNAVFKQMVAKLTAQKAYDKVDEVFRTLIANGQKSNNAQLVAQSYNSYIAWKDSANALRAADEVRALKQQIADNETAIAEKDHTLTIRQVFIIGLIVLAAILAAALIVGIIALMRYILLSRKQKKIIRQANDSNAQKAKFISNIAAQLEPTLRKLGDNKPEAKALLEFTAHIQTLSDLENDASQEVELEETQVHQFCEQLMEQIRDQVRKDVVLTVNAPKMNAPICREYTTHVLLHLLRNAAEYTPAEGKITLEFKKRGQHTHQFLVTDTGSGIAEEQRAELFIPFRAVRDLTQGDGLGLPICRQMAIKMNGTLDIDPTYTKGTRFVLELHV